MDELVVMKQPYPLGDRLRVEGGAVCRGVLSENPERTGTMCSANAVRAH